MDAYQQIEADFLARFPQGLQDEAWLALGKKHRSIDGVIALCRDGLAEPLLRAAVESGNSAAVIDTCRHIVGRCSTVSTFEKMAFRNYLAFSDVHRPFVAALYALLYRFDETSFADFVEVLQLCRNDGNANPAKWPLVSCFLAYSDPQRHVCIKPTTIKKLAARLEVDIAYRPLPNFDTYCRVQAMVLDFRRHSRLAAEQNNIIAQAVMYCTV
ncbi:hypothetical protein [Vogesella sp. LIG4]|uniref:hypothetical protein n=1 Tax=Vogesella sp. LIG4 TaxID=1192162 RepID=UPI00081FF77D|nr:hypothetical protein [Vogesella sp. LIG4]SCK04811.1 hypothetical protein PSELUDRAFT_0013 [Vogesella sp. LIG4]